MWIKKTSDQAITRSKPAGCSPYQMALVFLIWNLTHNGQKNLSQPLNCNCAGSSKNLNTIFLFCKQFCITRAAVIYKTEEHIILPVHSIDKNSKAKSVFILAIKYSHLNSLPPFLSTSCLPGEDICRYMYIPISHPESW